MRNFLVNTSFNRDDVLQEFKLKIYTGILGYLKRWKTYKETGKFKPVPLEYYLRTVLNSKVNDFIKGVINNDVVVNTSDYTVDFGKPDEYTTIDWKNHIIVVRGVNLLEGLTTKDEKGCFCLYLKGYSIKKVVELYRKKKINARAVIRTQLDRLQQYEEELHTVDTDIKVQIVKK